MSMTAPETPGISYPLGVTLTPDGANFCVFSKTAYEVHLLLFDDVGDAKASRSICMSRHSDHHTFQYWHVFIPGVKAGQVYGYRVDGPFKPIEGHRFDWGKLLLDPYGRCVAVPHDYCREKLSQPGDHAAISMKSVVADMSAYDWEDDQPIFRSFSRSVIYEMHVGGFTRHPNSGVTPELRGTYRGLIEKIPYLQKLGVTAVELLPVYQFDPQQAPPGLTNYWGYNPVSFFAPHAGYAVPGSSPLGVLDDFRDMVKALHRADIQVILDVVYNHTGEGNEFGPTLCFKGFENLAYYLRDRQSGEYLDFSGTGNTLNANHSVVRRLIIDSLHYWVSEMHVDGFRFDLASILARDSDGQLQPKPPILWDIETDPFLCGKKLIAEAWDAAGLYQVGSFFGDRWKEWNGRFRDDVRAFLKGDEGYAGKLASRFLASPDLYGHEQREPEQSINFVTCHDGFTLNDLVSYDQKHNEDNLESNQDGNDYNLSWNCGVEGPSDDPEIERLRLRQIKNALVVNLLALGTPMILMGDEVRRTQHGNNNAYCQDNELSWFDWELVEKNRELFEFVKKLIEFRLKFPFRDEGAMTLMELLHRTQIDWHGVKLFEPDWGPHSRVVAFTLHGHRNRFHVIYNAYWEPLEFELPPCPSDVSPEWTKLIDTSADGPDDFCVEQRGCPVQSLSYVVPDRTLIVFRCKGTREVEELRTGISG